MDLMIVCQACQGSGLRVSVVGYSGSDITGEMVVPRRCRECSGAGRVGTAGWSSGADPDDGPGAAD
ncbi:hypothetical protein [Streptomonospora wellingtoniae]|uniref:Molecular chaperone DnaJ n=1 Tax=Streptomonospora wellingtoniae TaxID=3075544 RepID=A0ABU2KX46_9ACTN|nr:hypothetical protein [Streptomonospora sp. DSM 45055]MDT0303791.1 hypothetical protein [Streptomonospora sp. DSM 45055]